MNKTVSNLTIIVIGALLLSACAQKALAQQPAEAATQQPAPVAVEVGTAVPGVVSQPLSEMTPVTPTPITADASGQTIITRDAQGQTINMAVGQSFLLQLGEGYTWDIVISDQSVLDRDKNIAVVKGAQGVYEALKAGTVTVSASGDPLCRQSKPACGMPSIQVEFTVIVK